MEFLYFSLQKYELKMKRQNKTMRIIQRMPRGQVWQQMADVKSKYKQNNNNAMKQLKIWSMMMLMVMAMPLNDDY